MSRIDESLSEDERIIYRTGLHWVILGFPALLLFLSGISIRSKGTSAIIIFLAALLWGILSYVVLQYNEFVVTNKRLLVWTVFPWKKLRSETFANIAKLGLYQPTLGKFLNFGRITIALSGKRGLSYRMVNAPHELLMRLQNFIEEAHETQQEPASGQSMSAHYKIVGK